MTTHRNNRNNSNLDWEPWIQTVSGIKFHYLSGSSREVVVEDMATALSRVPRWAGHTNHFYSVAQHSEWVSRRIEEVGGTKRQCLLGLVHDGTEAYMLDLPSPLKVMIPEFKEFENKLWKKISRRFFGRVIPIDGIVKEIDRMALTTEARDLFSFEPIDDWVNKAYRQMKDGVKLPIAHLKIIKPVGPVAAYRLFMNRYEELTNEL